MRIMLFQGSPRRLDNCPNQWGKTKLLADFIIANAPEDVEIDYCDLSVSPETVIKPCKGCVSTANGFHCHYKCDCYAPDSPNELYQDYMHNANIYGRMEDACGFLILTPINWYSASSQVKLMFDRLSCINMTITAEQAKELGINKDAKKSAAAEQSGKFHYLLKNHYEGKYAAFFVHGDAGGSDYYELANKKKNYLPTFPESYTRYMKKDLGAGWIDDPRNVVQNLVWQCRYSGIFVPEDLIIGINATEGISYSESMQKALTNLDEFYDEGLGLLLRLREYCRE